MKDLLNTFHHFLMSKHFGILRFLLVWTFIVVCYFCWVVMSHGSSIASGYDENGKTMNTMRWTNMTSTISPVSKFISNQEPAPFFRNYISLNCSELVRTVRKPPVPSSEEYYCDMMDWCQSEASTRFTPDDKLCECLPSGLYGNVLHSITDLLGVTWQQINTYLGQVMSPGGHRKPADCITRRRVAVIIPYRDRERHLRVMLTHIHPILQRQQLEYQIFVIEQAKPFTFNKGSLLNIGFLESQKVFDADCILLLDVDTLPERDDNMIICGKQPVHWAGYVNRTAYAFIPTHSGGAILVTAGQYLELNGYPNVYWGWGGEDDDFRHRIKAKKMSLYTAAKNISYFTLVSHIRDQAFKKNNNRLKILRVSKLRSDLHAADGINTVKYDVINYQNYTSYTWIHVDLKEPDLSLLRKIDSGMFHLCKEQQMVTFKESDIYRSYDFCCHHNRSAEHHTNQLRFYKSVVTCEHMCQNLKTCVAFLYTQPLTGDNYCTLLTNICLLSPCDILDSEGKTQIYIPEKYRSKFNVTETKSGHLNHLFNAVS